MKITVEIINERFSYDFEISKETGHGSNDLTCEGLALFVAILDVCKRQWNYKTKQEIKEIECYAYLEKHPELVKEFKKFKK